MEQRELEFFKKKISSNIDKALDGGVVLLPFMDETKQMIIENMVKREKCVLVDFVGGFTNADYKRVIIRPIGYDDVDAKIRVYKILYSHKYLEPNHRMVLGTLMSLGIKRESIGDIYINDELDVYFACTEEISPYLLENFKTLGRVSIELSLMEEEVVIFRKEEIKTKFLASMRLDVVLAGAYNLSRKEAEEMITVGLVNVNHLPMLNCSLQLKENDLLSVRHKGRVRVHNIGSNTKSSRIIVELAYQC